MYDNNEIDQYVNTRYVGAPEAMWRLLEYKMHNKSHVVIRLPVHLPREQMIVFEEGAEREQLIKELDKDTRCQPISNYKKKMKKQEGIIIQKSPCTMYLKIINGVKNNDLKIELLQECIL